eukprot:gene16793-biopygen7617
MPAFTVSDFLLRFPTSLGRTPNAGRTTRRGRLQYSYTVLEPVKLCWRYAGAIPGQYSYTVLEPVKLCWRNAGAILRQYSHTVLGQYSNTVLGQYSNTVLGQYNYTVMGQHSDTGACVEVVGGEKVDDAAARKAGASAAPRPRRARRLHSAVWARSPG